MNYQNFDNNQISETYFIIGATGGIGRALCRRLAQSGAQLVIGARGEEKLQQLADEIGAHYFPVDATQPQNVAQFFAQGLETTGGKIDGAVNCAGSMLLKSAHLTTDDEWHNLIATNLTSAFATVREGAKAMMKHGGSVVLMSSCAARIGLPNHEGIAAVKGGINSLTLSAAATYARYNIRVNAVAPGLVRTPMTQRLTSNESTLQASTAMHPLGRIGEPEDVAATIEFLLDARSSWITGQILGVDGGLASLKTR